AEVLLRAAIFTKIGRSVTKDIHSYKTQPKCYYRPLYLQNSAEVLLRAAIFTKIGRSVTKDIHSYKTQPKCY
ncbi:hypothetical protein ACUXQS_000392, partial [Mammaliicoccus sciuri]